MDRELIIALVSRTLRAMLGFFIRPGEATRLLQDKTAPWLAPLLPALALCAYLLARGCAAGDAAAAGVGLLGLLVAAGLVGACATYLASFVTGADFPVRDRIGPCLLFAAWTALLFALLVFLVRWLGPGLPAPLCASLILVAWGVAAGSGVVRGEETEAGRALVGSCIGLAGALVGLTLALLLVQAQLLLIVPAPVEGPGFAPGAALLVRRETASAPPGAIILMRAPGGPGVLLARVNATGEPETLGSPGEPAPVLRESDMIGRVFFQFGSSGGGSVLPSKQRD